MTQAPDNQPGWKPHPDHPEWERYWNGDHWEGGPRKRDLPPTDWGESAEASQEKSPEVRTPEEALPPLGRFVASRRNEDAEHLEDSTQPAVTDAQPEPEASRATSEGTDPSQAGTDPASSVAQRSGRIRLLVIFLLAASAICSFVLARSAESPTNQRAGRSSISNGRDAAKLAAGLKRSNGGMFSSLYAQSSVICEPTGAITRRGKQISLYSCTTTSGNGTERTADWVYSPQAASAARVSEGGEADSPPTSAEEAVATISPVYVARGSKNPSVTCSPKKGKDDAGFDLPPNLYSCTASTNGTVIHVEWQWNTDGTVGREWLDPSSL